MNRLFSHVFRQVFQRTLGWSALAFSVLAAGCGLSDYEQRMDQQTERIRVIEEENRTLGNTVKIPTYAKGKDGAQASYWPFEIFFRVPKDISEQNADRPFAATKEVPAGYEIVPLIRYAGNKEGYNVFIAAANITEKKGAAKEESHQEGEWPTDVFRNLVRGALRDFLTKEKMPDGGLPDFNNKESFKADIKESSAFKGVAGTKIVYESTRFDRENSAFLVYFHQPIGRQLAIVFQVPKDSLSNSATMKSIEWSLKSLELNPGLIAAKKAAVGQRRAR